MLEAYKQVYANLDSCQSCGCCDGYCRVIGSHGPDCTTGRGGGILWATNDGKAACEDCGAVVERLADWSGLCGPCDPPHYPKTCKGCGAAIASPTGEASCYNFAGGADALCSECGDHECEGACHP